MVIVGVVTPPRPPDVQHGGDGVADPAGDGHGFALLHCDRHIW